MAVLWMMTGDEMTTDSLSVGAVMMLKQRQLPVTGAGAACPQTLPAANQLYAMCQIIPS